MNLKLGFCFLLAFCSVAFGASTNRPDKKNVCTKEWLSCMNKDGGAKKVSTPPVSTQSLKVNVIELATKNAKGVVTEDADLSTNVLKELTRMTARLSQFKDVMLRKVFKGMCICNASSSYQLVKHGGKTAVKIPVEKFGNEYTFYLVKLTWNEAKVFCDTHDSHLATIETKEENTFLWNFIRKNYLLNTMERIWFGASDKEKEGTWKWLSNKPLTFNDWSSGEPNNWHLDTGGENCIQFFKPHGFHWNDGRCYQKWPILCERKLK